MKGNEGQNLGKPWENVLHQGDEGQNPGKPPKNVLHNGNNCL